MTVSKILVSATEATARKKAMKRLTCRKCEGHGFVSILKGHAASCPFNECSCNTCSSVMSMRANALIRRFRHRQPNQNSAVLKTIRSKNGNMRLRIVPKAGQTDMDTQGATMVHYDERRRSTCSSVSASSILSSTPESLVSLASSPALSPSPSSALQTTLSPSPTPQEALASRYFTQITQAALLAQLLTASQTTPLPLLTQNLASTTPEGFPTFEQLMVQQLLLSSMTNSVQQPQNPSLQQLLLDPAQLFH